MATSVIKGRWLWLALAAYAAVFAASLFLRPMWRDEFWALYFSGVGKPLPDVIEAVTRDVHPPLYFVMLHYWRMLFEDPLWVRAFNVAVIALAGIAAWALRGQRREETATFIFLCATSYWLIFYGVEARMMVMEFVLCALSVLIIRNALDERGKSGQAALLFFVVGLLAASSHFFGALWTAVAGACAGFALLRRGDIGGFFAWGIASVAAIAPVTAWILYVDPGNATGAANIQESIAESFGDAAHQFSRGLFVKTLFGNLAATAAAVLCIGALIRRKDAFTLVILLAALFTVVVAFGLHIFLLPMIKERAFIVMMPAVIYLIAQAMHSAGEDQKRAQWLIRAVPIAAIVALPLFSIEYFKDRERVAAVRELIDENADACAGQPIVAHFRPSQQAEDFGGFFTRAVLAGAAGGRDVILVDGAELARTGARPPASTCPIKALALSLPRGEDPEHAEARASLRAAGVDLDGLEEIRISAGRGLVYRSGGQPQASE